MMVGTGGLVKIVVFPNLGSDFEGQLQLVAVKSWITVLISWKSTFFFIILNLRKFLWQII